MLVSEQFPEVASLSPFSHDTGHEVWRQAALLTEPSGQFLLAFVVQGIPKEKSLRLWVEQVKDRVRSMAAGAEL